ncbi:phage regulatory protein/antirepressor Ant [Brevibacillus laterosporus]|uniref:phage antirepressor KilAC domain-containing protein n=1 Tax=Brevibacillus laterosporus TaxID=1465 RepID=UPI003D1BFCA7
MIKLVFIDKGKVITDTRIVAETFSKEHRRVMQDIRDLNCSKEFRQHNFVLSSYRSQQNKELPKYNMTRDGFTFLVMGYTGKEAARFKEDYIRAFNQMEQQLALVSTPSYMIDDPIRRAEKWIEEQKQYQVVEGKALALEQRVAEYEPKITYLDHIINSKDTVTITQVAKDYGLTGQQLNKILNQEKIQYKQNGQWLLYRDHHDKGYTKSITVDVPHKDGTTTVKMNTRWTQKGRLFIHTLLTNRGIIPEMDKQIAN